MLHVFGFFCCATIIFFAGKKLSHYGDLLATKTGMSKGWVGLILMASVTSLPELMVGISSSAIVQSADLAVGDILGSCAFNLGILAMLDAFTPKNRPLFGIASQTHILNAGLGIILVAIVGLAMFIPHDLPITPWLALSSLVFIGFYLGSVRIIYLNEKNHKQDHVSINLENNTDNSLSLNNIIKKYILYACIIIVSALALPFFAEEISTMTGLGTSFIGTLFLAGSTSLPEIAVSIASVKMGAIDLAVGNLLGSNIFNVLILAIDDIFYSKGLLLRDASSFHLISVICTIMMASVVVISLSFRARGKRFFMNWDGILILIIYLFNLFLLYRFTS